FDYDEQILELLCEDDPMSHEKLLIDCSNDLQPILKDLKQHTSVDQAISFQRDFNVPLQHGSVGTQNTLVDSTITANHETELSEHNNNKLPSTNDTSPKRPLKEIFTLPSEYLPKKKRLKLEKSGKSKLPSVGTSNEWYQHQLEKENLKKIKEEKLKNKKKLQEEKKKLMD
ncbi:GSCOCG00012746001-RA-CDS, partial [Cotesia congregata]